MPKHKGLKPVKKARFAFTPVQTKARYYMDSKGCWYTKGDGRHVKCYTSDISVPLLTDLLAAVAP